MTKKFKDFGQSNVSDLPEIKFKLHGEEFVCHRAIQGKVLLEVAGGFDETKTSNANQIIDDFFKIALEPESFDRFYTLIHDPEKIVLVETLGEITGWLVEQYSARPTEEPSGS